MHGCLLRLFGVVFLIFFIVVFVVCVFYSLSQNEWNFEKAIENIEYDYDEECGFFIFIAVMFLLASLIMIPVSFSKSHAIQEANDYIKLYTEECQKVSDTQFVNEWDMNKLSDKEHYKELADYWYKRATK